MKAELSLSWHKGYCIEDEGLELASSVRRKDESKRRKCMKMKRHIFSMDNKKANGIEDD